MEPNPRPEPQDATPAAPAPAVQGEPGVAPAPPGDRSAAAGQATETTAPEGGVPAAPAGPRSTTGGLVAVGLLIAMVMVLGLVVLALRKRLFRSDAPQDASSGFLDDLRASLREGRISQEEFDAAKRAMVLRLARAGTPEKNGQRGL